jgi:hypothetical protein
MSTTDLTDLNGLFTQRPITFPSAASWSASP